MKKLLLVLVLVSSSSVMAISRAQLSTNSSMAKAQSSTKPLPNGAKKNSYLNRCTECFVTQNNVLMCVCRIGDNFWGNTSIKLPEGYENNPNVQIGVSKKGKLEQLLY